VKMLINMPCQQKDVPQCIAPSPTLLQHEAELANHYKMSEESIKIMMDKCTFELLRTYLSWMKDHIINLIITMNNGCK
jgi:hypothetical protein